MADDPRLDNPCTALVASEGAARRSNRERSLDPATAARVDQRSARPRKSRARSSVRSAAPSACAMWELSSSTTYSEPGITRCAASGRIAGVHLVVTTGEHEQFGASDLAETLMTLSGVTVELARPVHRVITLRISREDREALDEPVGHGSTRGRGGVCRTPAPPPDMPDRAVRTRLSCSRSFVASTSAGSSDRSRCTSGIHGDACRRALRRWAEPTRRAGRMRTACRASRPRNAPRICTRSNPGASRARPVHLLDDSASRGRAAGSARPDPDWS